MINEDRKHIIQPILSNTLLSYFDRVRLKIICTFISKKRFFAMLLIICVYDNFVCDCHIT